MFTVFFLRTVDHGDNTAEEKSVEYIKLGIPIIKKTPGGLANVLSQIGKKNKLTVLEKSKQDWDGYKQKEGIVEELVSHNKGKDGFVITNKCCIHCKKHKLIIIYIFILGT